MPIYRGSNEITRIYRGSTEIFAIYRGGRQIFSGLPSSTWGVFHQPIVARPALTLQPVGWQPPWVWGVIAQPTTSRPTWSAN